MKRTISRVISCFLIVLLLLPVVPAKAEVLVGQMHHVDQVMIYNPRIWSKYTPNYMSTGDMSGQIQERASNASLMEEEESLVMGLDPEQIARDLENLVWEDGDASLMEEETEQETFTVGSKKTFIYSPTGQFLGGDDKQTAEFTCYYASKDCLIWGYDLDPEMLDTLKVRMQTLGTNFDTKTREICESTFGTAYFMQGDNPQPLNILIYPFQMGNTIGFFHPMEMLRNTQMSAYDATRFNLATPMIHINAKIVKWDNYQNYCDNTIAHEFQHLICFSSTLESYDANRTAYNTMGDWINEAMSQQAAELVNPGCMKKMGYLEDYNESSLIGWGYSLYDFTTGINDIGVYGQVFLFSEYIKQQYGSGEVFQALHNYWRGCQTDDSMTDAKMLQAVLESKIGAELEKRMPDIKLENTADTFLSRLNLAYQIAVILQEDEGIYSMTELCEDADPRVFLTYNESSREIAGGGRILVNTQDGETYTFPEDADPGLIYVGFQDGKMTVPPTTAANYKKIPETTEVSVTSAVTKDGERIITCEIGVPEDKKCTLLVTAVDKATGKMLDVVTLSLDLHRNVYEESVTLSDDGTIYYVFLVDDAQTPLIQRQSVEVS